MLRYRHCSSCNIYIFIISSQCQGLSVSWLSLHLPNHFIVGWMWRQASFFYRGKIGLNSDFSFSEISCWSNANNVENLFYSYNGGKKWWIHVFIRTLMRSETRTVLLGIRTRVAHTISCGNNRYAKCASIFRLGVGFLWLNLSFRGPSPPGVCLLAGLSL